MGGGRTPSTMRLSCARQSAAMSAPASRSGCLSLADSRSASASPAGLAAQAAAAASFRPKPCRPHDLSPRGRGTHLGAPVCPDLVEGAEVNDGGCWGAEVPSSLVGQRARGAEGKAKSGEVR